MIKNLNCKRLKNDKKKNWPKWKKAMHAELQLLIKQEVYGLVVQTSKIIKLVGYKWVFVQKRPNGL